VDLPKERLDEAALAAAAGNLQVARTEDDGAGVAKGSEALLG
jgi:hypothetical protein